jgi:hypothetical protein
MYRSSVLDGGVVVVTETTWGNIAEGGGELEGLSRWLAEDARGGKHEEKNEI